MYFDVGILFDVCLSSSMSNRGAKSKIEFAATENQWNKAVGHATKIFIKYVNSLRHNII